MLDNQRRKLDVRAKKSLVKSTLDRQITDQARERIKIDEYNKKMDTLLLANAQREIEQDKKERIALKHKVENQKVIRDQMLTEAKVKRMNEFKQVRQKEILEVEVLKKEIHDEFRTKVEKRIKEKEDAWKIIKMNEKQKEKRMAEKEADRTDQQKMIEKYNATIEK